MRLRRSHYEQLIHGAQTLSQATQRMRDDQAAFELRIIELERERSDMISLILRLEKQRNAAWFAMRSWQRAASFGARAIMWLFSSRMQQAEANVYGIAIPAVYPEPGLERLHKQLREDLSRNATTA